MNKNFFIVSFGQYLRRKRKEAKMSQERLAELVTARGHTITGAYISMIEREYDKRKSGEPTRINKGFVTIAAEVLGADVNEALIQADYAPIESNATGLDIIRTALLKRDVRPEDRARFDLAYKLAVETGKAILAAEDKDETPAKEP